MMGRPVAIESRNKKNEVIEHNEYKYDLTGNITKITDKTDAANTGNTRTQEFKYDALNRLTNAKGVYGEQNFEYTPAGNLTKNSHGELTYSDDSHPYAVTADGEGNSYSYDANGNMTTGRGREMKYDASGRLVSLKKWGTEIQKNYYDHTGHRVLQQKKDGTLVYNINGMYEVVKAPNRLDHHTKYIYGMEGDIAAQVTTAGASLVGANFDKGFLFDKGYGSSRLTAFLAKGYIISDKYFAKAENILHLQYALIIILFAALIGAIVKSGITRRKRRVKGNTHNIWSSAVSLIIVTAMAASLTLTGCEVTGPGRDDVVVTDTSSDEDTTQGTGTVSGGGSETDTGTDDTSTTGTGTGTGTGGHTTHTTASSGLPILGTYYFHPDHIGSVSYLTDASGKVVTRMSYTPYGEKVKSAGSGPDVFHQKYTGQVDDGEEAELLYYNARYYDPKLGRFISADSTVPDPTSTQAFNRYMYVQGNPITYNDPTGYSMSDGAASVGAAGGSDISGAGSSVSSGGGHGGNSQLAYSFHPTNHTVNPIGRDGATCICSAGSRLSNNGHGNTSVDNTNYPDEENLAENDTHTMNFPISSTDYIGTSDKTGSYQNWRPRSHTGVDIIAKKGTNVYSTIIGKVTFAGETRGYGKFVIVEDDEGYQYLAAHLSKIFVKEGDSVRRGQRIGLSGFTGNVRPAGERGAHIHFEVRDPGGSPLDLDTGEQLNIIIRVDIDRIKRIQRIIRRGGV